MKTAFLISLMSAVLLIGGVNLVSGQDQPKPKKDTVNIDTDAKPQFYYAEEEEAGKKSNTGAIVGAGAVVVIAAGYFFFRKKKQ